MNDVANLEIRVHTSKVKEATHELEGLGSAATKTEGATDKLVASFRGAVGPLVSMAAAVGALRHVIDVTREFEKLNAGLITATGSAEEAKLAFAAIQDFAQNTPYDLNQVGEAFVKLVNYGLTPSERALTSYGNTASALGKDLKQMIEAVADAQTGQFERLKEFGIKSEKEGDRVKFTFRGVATEVGFSAKEIEEYLIKLGENNFADAMSNRMATLDGAISNLADEWTKLVTNVSQAGLGDVIQEHVRMATSALAELNAQLQSGEMQANIAAIGSKFDNVFSDIQKTIQLTREAFGKEFRAMEPIASATINFVIDAFRNFPENVRAIVQIATTYVATMFSNIMAHATAFKEAMLALASDDTLANVGARLNTALERNEETRQESIAAIMKERDAALESFARQREAAKKLREDFDKAAAAKPKGDRLGKYGIGGSDKGATSGVGKAAAAKAGKDELEQVVASLRTQEEALEESYKKRKAIIEKHSASGSPRREELIGKLDSQYAEELEKLTKHKNREVEEIRRSLLTEEESISESYAKRRQIVEENTAIDSALREQLLQKLQTQHETQLAELEAMKQRERESLWNGLLTEEEMITRSYESRRKKILDSTLVTETERQDLMKRLSQQYIDEMAAMENRRIQTQLEGAAAMFNGLAGLAKSYAGEQSKAYRILFAISKAFSITQAIMSISTGLAKAQELGFPANLAAMAQVAATGAQILSTIRGSNFSGAYDKGGYIPAGKEGLVGEYGPELVSGPAHVTSRKDTAKKLAAAGNDSSSRIRIINAFDSSAVMDYLGSDEGERVILNVIRKNGTSVAAFARGE